jgi:hypothetical protein
MTGLFQRRIASVRAKRNLCSFLILLISSLICLLRIKWGYTFNIRTATSVTNQPANCMELRTSWETASRSASQRFYMILTMVYSTKNYWVFGIFTSSGVLGSKGPNWVGVFFPLPFTWGRKQIQFPKPCVSTPRNIGRWGKSKNPIFLCTERFPNVLLNPKDHNSVHKNQLLVPILSHINPVHINPSYFFKIHFTQILRCLWCSINIWNLAVENMQIMREQRRLSRYAMCTVPKSFSKVSICPNIISSLSHSLCIWSHLISSLWYWFYCILLSIY